MGSRLPDSFSSRGIVKKAYSGATMNIKACRWSSYGSAPAVKKRRSGGTQRVSASKRDSTTARWYIVSWNLATAISKDDIRDSGW